MIAPARPAKASPTFCDTKPALVIMVTAAKPTQIAHASRLRTWWPAIRNAQAIVGNTTVVPSTTKPIVANSTLFTAVLPRLAA